MMNARMNARMNGWLGVDAILNELKEGDVVLEVEDVSVALGKGVCVCVYSPSKK